MKHFKVQKEFSLLRNMFVYAIYKRRFFLFWKNIENGVVFSDIESAMEYIYEYMDGEDEEYEIDVNYGIYD